jgi:iron complex outermembrane recepter protein
MISRRIALVCGTAAIALTSPALAQNAAAPGAKPQASAEAEVEPGEITVTARRVSESLTKVPASITVFSEAQIERSNIQRAQDFTQLTPGVTLVSNSVQAGDTQINIRGINGARDAESSVALVVDGILKTNTSALNQSQGTLKQIEILKGPQGALYGRNAAAGAIVIGTAKPGDHLAGSFTASYAENKTANLNGYIGGPIAPGVGLLVSGNYHTTDGFFTNRFLNAKVVDDQKFWDVNGRLTAELGGDTNLDAKVRYGKLNGASINFNASFELPGLAGANPAFFEDINDHPFNYYSNIRPVDRQTTFEASLKLDHDFGPVRLTAWGLYTNTQNTLIADGTSGDFARYSLPSANNPTSNFVSGRCFSSTAALTGFPVNQPGFIGTSPVPFIFAPATGSTFGPYSPTTCDGIQYQVHNQKDISGEIRLASNSDGPVQWQLGAYYLHIKRFVGVALNSDTGQGVVDQLYNEPSSINPTSQLFADNFDTNVYAAFASAQYKATDRLHIDAALRYDIEARRVESAVPFVIDPITGGPINPGQASGPIAPQSRTFRQLEPKISIRFDVNLHTSLFANWGIGFKSGGFNNRGTRVLVDQAFNNSAINAGVIVNDDFDKETSSAFEAGIKGRFGPIRYDLAGYYTQVKGLQFFEFFVGSFGLLRVVSNIDRIDLKGIEANVNTELVKGWTVYASGNLTDSKIKKNTARPITVGNKSPYTADYTINLGTQALVPLGGSIKGLFKIDYRLTGPTFFQPVQDETVPTIFSQLLPISALALPASVGDANYSKTRRKAFGVVDIRAGLEGANWRASVFATNVFNKKYVSDVVTATEFGGTFISPGARRLIGVEVGYKF